MMRPVPDLRTCQLRVVGDLCDVDVFIPSTRRLPSVAFVCMCSFIDTR